MRDDVQCIAELSLDRVGMVAEIGATNGEPAEPTRKGRARKGKVLRTAPEVKRTLERFLLPKFGDRPIGDVTRRELIALFDGIADVNGPIAANRALSWVRRFFKWARVLRDMVNGFSLLP